MKTLLILFISIGSTFSLSAQEIIGRWNGVLKVQGVQLRLVFNVTEFDDGLSATMDSPDQGAKEIPVTKTTFENSTIKFEISNARIEYIGELIGNEIIGTFKQSGQEFPLKLSRNEIEKEEVKRPQEPTEPYTYHSEDVEFKNTKANILLSGTLTLPKKEGIYPVVILISGSGPQNRNEEVVGHKPFLVISDYLTKNGIGVLRYDDRGIGESEGDFSTATSADFATDVESAIVYLKSRKEINKNKIGLIGHSEGGLIAPMVASKSKDVNFIVLLAGPGIRGDKILLLQQELIARASGVAEDEIMKSQKTNAKIFETIVKSEDSIKLKSDLTVLLNEALKNETPSNGITKDELIIQQVNQISHPWMQYFIRFDPATTLKKVKCPVLAINGEKDLQVPPKENLSAIKKALIKGGNKKVTTKEYLNLNHLFQESETGLPSEYSTIEQTFSPIVLEEITKWITVQTN